MRYHEMQALFAQLAANGRLSVHLAYQTTRPVHPWEEIGAPSWTVVLRDNARVLIPGSDIRCLYAVADSTDIATVARRPDWLAIAGLCCLDVTADPACRLLWPEVLRLLDVVSMRFPAWRVTAIVGTQEPEPRYSVTLRTQTGAPRPVASYAVFDHLCLEASPLAPQSFPVEQAALTVGAPSLDAASERISSRQEPVTALVFAPARPPRVSTLGGLTWLAPPGVATWVDLCAPRRDELLAVARQLCLPYRALLAALSPTTEFGCRATRQHLVMRLPVARREPLSGRIQADALDLIVGRHAVVSIHASPLPALMRTRRGVQHALDHSQTSVSLLCGSILHEVLCSEEALARWLVQEGVRRPERPTRVSELVQVIQTATELRQLVERRYEMLADADRLARQRFELDLRPWWGDAMRCPQHLLDTLRRAEQTAEDTMGQAIFSRLGHGRYRAERLRLWMARMVRTRRRPGGLTS